MEIHNLHAVSPIDGRYYRQSNPLTDYFSEYALIKYRVHIEIEYFIALVELGLPGLEDFDKNQFVALRKIVSNFYDEAALRIKEIENTTNHDVKAVEYFLKERFESLGLTRYKEFIHFGLTSQDINNTAIPLSLKDYLNDFYYPDLNELISLLEEYAEQWNDIAMLARTHGQPASPTRLGKEIKVFTERLKVQQNLMKQVAITAKFGGATGNMNAHYITYPNIDWHGFANKFIEEKIGLKRSFPTTQIDHYDNLAAIFHNLLRINTILIDFARDIWTYISMDYFKQKIKTGEVGSSAMPHKVNPIDFENAEGNMGVANAIFSHLAEKLPISRLQRDLTDSTVLRNIGVPLAHTAIAFSSLAKGIGKLLLNQEKINQDLNNNWAVVAEAIQTILRRENYPNPYEALKMLTRTNTSISEQSILDFIMQLDVSENVKNELMAISPFNYTGK